MDRYFFDYTKLKNGIGVLSYPRNDVNGAGIEIQIDAGSIDEEKSVNGISHALEHLVYRGSSDFNTRDEIIAYENNHALDIHSAHTSDIETVFEGFGIYTDLEKVIYILSQLILNPLLRDKDWKIEKSIILDEIQRRMDKPWFQLFSELNRSRFKDKYFFLGQDVAGDIENIRTMGINKIVEYHHEYYHPSNMRISVAGNIDIKEVHNMILKYFPDEGQNKIDKTHRNISKTQEIYSDFSLQTIKRQEKRIYLALTFPGLTQDDSPKDRMTLTLVKALLTDRMDSLLWKALRENLGLVYDISATNTITPFYGIFAIYCDFHPDLIEKVLKEIIIEIDKLKEGDFNEDMLRNEIEVRNKHSMLTFDNIKGAVTWLSRELDEEKIQLPEEYIEIRNSITKQDVINIARKVLDWNLVNIGIVGPITHDKAEDLITSQLKKELGFI